MSTLPQILMCMAILSSYMYTYFNIPVEQHFKVAVVGFFFLSTTFVLCVSKEKLSRLLKAHKEKATIIPSRLTSDLVTLDRLFTYTALIITALLSFVMIRLSSNIQDVHLSIILLVVPIALPICVLAGYYFNIGISHSYGFYTEVNTTEVTLGTKIDYLRDSINTTPKDLIDSITVLNEVLEKTRLALAMDTKYYPVDEKIKYIHNYGIQLSVDLENLQNDIKEYINGT